MDRVEYMIKSLQKAFYHSSDLTVRQVDWHEGNTAILCFYTSLVDAKEVQKVLDTIYARLDTDKPFWSETLITTLDNFSLPSPLSEYVREKPSLFCLKQEKCWHLL